MRASTCFVYLLLLCIVKVHAIAWSDCGAPLSRVITFSAATVYPDPPSSEDSISLSVQVTVLSMVPDATTTVYVTKDGLVYLNTTSRNLCDILAYTQNTIPCPIPAGSYSYNDVYPLPTLPAGGYTVTITMTSTTSTEVYGCLSASLQVSDPSQASNVCTYTSWLQVALGTTSIQYKSGASFDQNVGDWVQIGPVGNAGSAGASFPWGSLVTYKGTTDVIDLGVDLSLYVWGINGSLVNVSTLPNGQAIEDFQGEFFLGLQAYSGAPVSDILPVLTGTFQLIFNYQAGRLPYQQILANPSFIDITPAYAQPLGFFYPLIFGNLNPFSITQMSNGALNLYGSKTWCTCPVDACNVCGGDGSACALNAPAHSDSSSGLSNYDIAALVVGLVGGIIGLLLIGLLSYCFVYRRGRESRSVRDDSDLAGPDKPDYGSMAINEVLADHGRPLVNA